MKDADGNIVETGLLDVLTAKGAQVTFDYNGNLIMVNNPKLKKGELTLGYEVKTGENVDGILLKLNDKDDDEITRHLKSESASQAIDRRSKGGTGID